MGLLGLFDSEPPIAGASESLSILLAACLVSNQLSQCTQSTSGYLPRPVFCCRQSHTGSGFCSQCWGRLYLLVEEHPQVPQPEQWLLVISSWLLWLLGFLGLPWPHHQQLFQKLYAVSVLRQVQLVLGEYLLLLDVVEHFVCSLTSF